MGSDFVVGLTVDTAAFHLTKKLFHHGQRVQMHRRQTLDEVNVGGGGVDPRRPSMKTDVVSEGPSSAASTGTTTRSASNLHAFAVTPPTAQTPGNPFASSSTALSPGAAGGDVASTTSQGGGVRRGDSMAVTGLDPLDEQPDEEARAARDRPSLDARPAPPVLFNGEVVVTASMTPKAAAMSPQTVPSTAQPATAKPPVLSLVGPGQSADGPLTSERLGMAQSNLGMALNMDVVLEETMEQ